MNKMTYINNNVLNKQEYDVKLKLKNNSDIN